MINFSDKQQKFCKDSINFDILANVNISHLISILNKITHFKDKIDVFNCFDYDNGAFHIKILSNELKNKLVDLFNKYGIDISTYNYSPIIEVESEFKNVNYACGDNYLKDWLNIDFFGSDGIVNSCQYKRVNLIEKHPFKSDIFQFGFCEDFLEHLEQEDSIIFLSEVFRTLKTGGVLRLSFPGLEGILQRHYNNKSNYFIGKFEAYAFWEHKHFYSKEELVLVAKQIGFLGIKFVEYGKSDYKQLNNLDTRKEQIGLNTYVELIK